MEISSERSLKLFMDKIVIWYELIIKGLPNLLLAFVVMLAFVFLAKISGRVIRKMMRKNVNNQAVQGLTESICFGIIILIGLFTALEILQLDKTVTSLLAGAGVIGVALGFAFQDIAANFVSGVFIAFRQPYTIGDIVEVEGYKGEVKDINLRTTSVVTFQGIEIFVPNKEMFTKPLRNYTTTPRRRLDIEVGVAYTDDLRKVEKIVVECLTSVPGRIKSEPIEVFYKKFAASSIVFDMRMWVAYPQDKNFLKARHESIIRIKEAFYENNITIPYPIQTVDFGVKGGQAMNASLLEGFKGDELNC